MASIYPPKLNGVANKSTKSTARVDINTAVGTNTSLLSVAKDTVRENESIARLPGVEVSRPGTMVASSRIYIPPTSKKSQTQSKYHHILDTTIPTPPGQLPRSLAKRSIKL